MRREGTFKDENRRQKTGRDDNGSRGERENDLLIL